MNTADEAQHLLAMFRSPFTSVTLRGEVLARIEAEMCSRLRRFKGFPKASSSDYDDKLVVWCINVRSSAESTRSCKAAARVLRICVGLREGELDFDLAIYGMILDYAVAGGGDQPHAAAKRPRTKRGPDVNDVAKYFNDRKDVKREPVAVDAADFFKTSRATIWRRVQDAKKLKLLS